MCEICDCDFLRCRLSRAQRRGLCVRKLTDQAGGRHLCRRKDVSLTSNHSPDHVQWRTLFRGLPQCLEEVMSFWSSAEAHLHVLHQTWRMRMCTPQTLRKVLRRIPSSTRDDEHQIQSPEFVHEPPAVRETMAPDSAVRVARVSSTLSIQGVVGSCTSTAFQ